MADSLYDHVNIPGTASGTPTPTPSADSFSVSGSSLFKGIALAGDLFSGFAALSAGKAQRESAYATALQLRYNAGQVQAVGQYQGEESLLQTKLLQSRMLAVAGSSGAGALDPTIVHLATTLQTRGEVDAAMYRFNADSKANSMRAQADATQREGDAYAKAGRYKALGSLLSAGALFI